MCIGRVGGTLARMLAQCLNFVFTASSPSRPDFAALSAAATPVMPILQPLTAAPRCHVVLGAVPNRVVLFQSGRRVVYVCFSGP